MPTPVEARSPGRSLLRSWNRLRGIPGGRRLFSLLLGARVPYTGTIRPLVTELEPGRCVVRLRDRRKVRNHLGSVHALALANLGELAGGLALITLLPVDWKAIVIHLETDYSKKARGPLEAEGNAVLPEKAPGEEGETRVTARITDAAGDEVARVTATWRIR